jgi:methyl-accepting chemotaxis protein
MPTDAQIKEITYLREYASILDDFKYYILGGCKALHNKAENVLDNSKSKLSIVKSTECICQNRADYVIRTYDDLVNRYNLSKENEALLGTTAKDAKKAIKEINNCANAIQEKVNDIISSINALTARTVTYSSAIEKMAEKGSEQIRKRCDMLEKYKEIK